MRSTGAWSFEGCTRIAAGQAWTQGAPNGDLVQQWNKAEVYCSSVAANLASFGHRVRKRRDLRHVGVARSATT